VKWYAALLLALAFTANAETITGRVVGVADGDTITVLDADKVQHKIRLAGIDAPEKKQAFGQRSKQSLSDLAFGKDVIVETTKRDKYRREIGKVLVNGRDADKVQHKIRLSGIDAPEKKQPFGNRSKESLSDLAFDKTADGETSKRDRYGRQIGKVLVNGRDVNLVQVERGMAWFYRQYQREQSPNDRRLYEAAEEAARAGKRGLWRDADPVPPWEFRRNKSKP